MRKSGGFGRTRHGVWTELSRPISAPRRLIPELEILCKITWKIGDSPCALVGAGEVFLTCIGVKRLVSIKPPSE